jgi:tetratricopeptide (TPR) repeat protein
LDAGLKALQELVAQNPKQAAFLALLADWLKEAGKQDAAVQAARLALQEGLEGLTLKQRADLHTMIGLQMRKNGQLDQAIHHLSEAILQSSDFLDAYLELGRVYHERREYQQALKIYQKAINLAGDDYRPYYQAGLVLKDNKDYMAAEAMLQRAAKLAPNELIVHRLLGAVVALNLVHGHRLTPGDARRD